MSFSTKPTDKASLRDFLNQAYEETITAAPDKAVLYAPRHLPERMPHKAKVRVPDAFQQEIARLEEEKMKAQAESSVPPTVVEAPKVRGVEELPSEFADFAASAAEFASRRRGSRSTAK